MPACLGTLCTWSHGRTTRSAADAGFFFFFGASWGPSFRYWRVITTFLGLYAAYLGVNVVGFSLVYSMLASWNFARTVICPPSIQPTLVDDTNEVQPLVSCPQWPFFEPFKFRADGNCYRSRAGHCQR